MWSLASSFDYQRCACASTRYSDRRSAAFIEWYETHSPRCDANYSGTSGGMEVKAAEVMWRQSLDRGFRYTTIVSDGDAKTARHLCDMRAYGDVEVVKEVCINHVCKRLQFVKGLNRYDGIMV